MLYELIIKIIKKLNPKQKESIGLKLYPLIQKKLKKEYIKLIFFEELLENLYGIDSQPLMEYKDYLNILSIDKDREDTKIGSCN